MNRRPGFHAVGVLVLYAILATACVQTKTHLKWPPGALGGYDSVVFARFPMDSTHAAWADLVWTSWSIPAGSFAELCGYFYKADSVTGKDQAVCPDPGAAPLPIDTARVILPLEIEGE